MAKEKGKREKMGIVIISGSCCLPGMAQLDAQARKAAEQAIKETGAEAQLEMVPVTAALGLLPKAAMNDLIEDFKNSGRIGLPLIMVNGKSVSSGIPDEKKIKAALLQAKKEAQK